MAMSNAHRKLMDVALNGNEHDMRKLLSHESFLVNVNRMMRPDYEVPLHKAMYNGDLGVAKVQHIEPHMHTKLNNLRTCVCFTQVFRKHERDFLCKVICVKEHTQTILIPSLFEFV
jgi:hypothetical protein